MKAGKIIIAVLSVILNIAGLVLTAGPLFAGDLVCLVYAASFLMGLVLTVLYLTEKAKGKIWRFLDLVLFAASLGLFLAFFRYRWPGLLLILSFPLRQLLRGRDTQPEQQEKKERFDEHINR